MLSDWSASILALLLAIAAVDSAPSNCGGFSAANDNGFVVCSGTSQPVQTTQTPVQRIELVLKQETEPTTTTTSSRVEVVEAPEVAPFVPAPVPVPVPPIVPPVPFPPVPFPPVPPVPPIVVPFSGIFAPIGPPFPRFRPSEDSEESEIISTPSQSSGIINNTSASVTVVFDCVQGDGDYVVGLCEPTFITCANNVATKSQCPAGLSFDPEKMICDFPAHVASCGGRAPFAEVVAADTVQCANIGAKIVAPGFICTQYYVECSEDGSSVTKMCDDDLIFDPQLKRCSPAQQVADCLFDCSDKQNGAYSVGCSAIYWWCQDGQASRQECPKGLLFDEDSTQCSNTPQFIFACGGTPTTTTALPIERDVPEVFFDCSTLEDGDYPLNAGQCLPNFVKCSGLSSGTMSLCPTGLVFDPVNLMCDFIHAIVACGGTTTTTTPKPSTISSFNAEELIDDGFCADKSNGMTGDGCAKHFYSCLGGKGTRMSCPNGLVFNEDINQCDFRRNVTVCVALLPVKFFPSTKAQQLSKKTTIPMTTTTTPLPTTSSFAIRKLSGSVVEQTTRLPVVTSSRTMFPSTTTAPFQMPRTSFETTSRRLAVSATTPKYLTTPMTTTQVPFTTRRSIAIIRNAVEVTTKSPFKAATTPASLTFTTRRVISKVMPETITPPPQQFRPTRLIQEQTTTTTLVPGVQIPMEQQYQDFA